MLECTKNVFLVGKVAGYFSPHNSCKKAVKESCGLALEGLAWNKESYLS